MADTGLLATLAFSENANNSMEVLWKVLTGKIEVNKGMLMENIVAQMLRAAGQELHFHKTPVNAHIDDRMEIDFLLTKTPVASRHNVMPIEVKSAKDYTTFSLERFKSKYASIASDGYVLHPGDVKLVNGITYLPLYMTPFLAENRFG